MNRLLTSILLLVMLVGSMQHSAAQTTLPKTISSGPFKAGHIQGIAIDTKQQHIYLSYTTMLIKTDYKGNILGSVVGLVGHLGDLTFNEKDGRVYGSLEYKDDSIGKNILKREGSAQQFPNSFYIAIFDGEKINRPNIPYNEAGIATSVHLKRVYDDYSATVTTPEGSFRYRLGCSGIDGVSIGPKLGKKGGKYYLTTAYGVYSDLKRNDNDYQVLHQYDISHWSKYEQPLAQIETGMHTSGPDSPDAEFYAYTGNTNYGVQNLEYDKEQKVWWMAVYKGSKKEFPNYSIFAVDGTAKPQKQPLKGVTYIPEGNVVPLQQRIPSLKDEATGVSGWHFGFGSTGFFPVGGGYYYISHNYANKEGQGSHLRLYRLTDNAEQIFELVK